MPNECPPSGPSRLPLKCSLGPGGGVRGTHQPNVQSTMEWMDTPKKSPKLFNPSTVRREVGGRRSVHRRPGANHLVGSAAQRPGCLLPEGWPPALRAHPWSSHRFPLFICLWASAVAWLLCRKSNQPPLYRRTDPWPGRLLWLSLDKVRVVVCPSGSRCFFLCGCNELGSK